MVSVKSCIASLYTENTDNAIVHTIRCSSLMPFPLVSPPFDFRVVIRVCLITMSHPSLAQYLSVRVQHVAPF